MGRTRPSLSRSGVRHGWLGGRRVELAAAERMRACGHQVLTPDLYNGQTAATIEAGFALADRTGWAKIIDRAREALRELPADAVLAGISMGAAVAEALLPARPGPPGVLLLHGLADIPSSTRADLMVQVHIADPDEYFSPARVALWREATRRGGLHLRRRRTLQHRPSFGRSRRAGV